MEHRTGECLRDRSRRPIRNKRYNRRNFVEERRPPKRLFTPEIKRFLKSWLVRRRDNPYPNRDEKKSLALQTGLTYIQVCNWFANWRRKLKNAGREPQRKTWGHLIKTYNNQVQGNVEHFSICSDDSIWQDGIHNMTYDETTSHKDLETDQMAVTPTDIRVSNNNNIYKNSQDHCYTVHDIRTNTANDNNNSNQIQPQCYLVSSTTETEIDSNPFSQPTSKYKNHIMEKYLKDCQRPENVTSITECKKEELTKPSMMSKWCESAANFRPSESNYLHWTLPKYHKKRMKKTHENVSLLPHAREELDAAETLTKLANAHTSDVWS